MWLHAYHTSGNIQWGIIFKKALNSHVSLSIKNKFPALCDGLNYHEYTNKQKTGNPEWKSTLSVLESTHQVKSSPEVDIRCTKMELFHQ